MQKNHLKTLAFFILLSSLLCLPLANSKLTRALAQEESEETSEETTEASPSATESLKERIEKVVEEKKEAVQEQIQELSFVKKGMIGQIERVSEEAITISNKSGTQVIPLTDNLDLVMDDETASVDDLAVDSWVTILGLQQENKDDFEPIRVLISEKTLRPRPQLVSIGAITEFDDDEVTILARGSEEELTFEIDKNTVITDPEAAKLTTDDLFEQMQCLVVGYKEVDEDESDEANEAENSSSTKHALIIRALVTAEE